MKFSATRLNNKSYCQSVQLEGLHMKMGVVTIVLHLALAFCLFIRLKYIGLLKPFIFVYVCVCFLEQELSGDNTLLTDYRLELVRKGDSN